MNKEKLSYEEWQAAGCPPGALFYQPGEKHNTQPLVEPAEAPVYPSEAAIREATRILSAAHQHHFTYLLNQGHTALRGCSCGLAFVGLMYGDIQNLKWHQVHEEGE